MDDSTKTMETDGFKPGDHVAALVDVYYRDGTWLTLARGEICTVRQLLKDGRVLVDNGSDPGVSLSPDQLLRLETGVNDFIWAQVEGKKRRQLPEGIEAVRFKEAAELLVIASEVDSDCRRQTGQARDQALVEFVLLFLGTGTHDLAAHVVNELVKARQMVTRGEE